MATNIIIPAQVFKFTGQTKVDIYLIDLDSLLNEQRMYDEVMVNKVRLALEAIRFYADEFPFWQRHQQTGRPPTEERTLLAAFLVRQLFDATFRETEGLLTLLSEYFPPGKGPRSYNHDSQVPASAGWRSGNGSTTSSSSSLRKRAPVIATDASGFSGRKRAWRETDHGLKATQDWIKIHAAIEVDQFFVLSYCLTESNVHDSQMFPRSMG